MKIKDILALDVSEEIKNVIDLEDITEVEIKAEIEGYIVTEGLAKEYADFVDKYTSGNNSETGVWISGFYGSGKSYFGKLLGYMLSNDMIVGTPARSRILQRFGGISDEALIKNSISRLDSVTSRVVFLDIAKQDTSKGFAYALFRNFKRSLELPQNEYGFLLFNLMIESQETDVHTFIKKNTAHEWQDIRGKLTTYFKVIKSIFIQNGNTEEDYNNVLTTIRDDINTFDAARLKEQVKQYLDINPNERVVFLFDETSEALTQNKFTLLDLEGVSEALSTLGGMVWTIAIAQEKLDDVINNSNVNKAQLTRVTDRFKTKIHLEATEVDIIIKNRLLQKTKQGIERLQTHYEAKSGQIQNHAALIGAGLTKTDSFESYSTYYPFYKYQFDLLQNFLFGTKGYASTKVAARGMIITTYEILRLDLKDTELFDTVTGWQITKEGQPQPDIRLVNRYDNAERILKEAKSVIHGRELLETITLLTEAEVTPSTLLNITKSYISNPEQELELKGEIEKALNLLTEAKILLYTNNNYRITSDIEQRLLDEMSGYMIQGFTKKKKLVDAYGSANFIKQISKISEDNMIYDFYITTDNDDELTKPKQKDLKVKFKSIYNFSNDRLGDIEKLKLDNQQEKGTIWVVPDNTEFRKIDRLIEEIEKTTYLEQKYGNPNSEEGKIMLSFSASKEEKQVELKKLIESALQNGTVIYLFNTFQLTKNNWESILKEQQRQVIENVFSRRLSTQLSDALAKSIIKERNESRLGTYFEGSDFAFFDSNGNFVGERLKVVEEILFKVRNTYVDGKTLEEELANPPTGFAFGTVMTTFAVLLRAGRVWIKYNGHFFYSWQDKGVEDVFTTARNFNKASFKAIYKTLSVSQKQQLAKFLLDIDVAQYRKKEEVRIDYNTNDYELVKAVRGVAMHFDLLVSELKGKESNFNTLFPHIDAKVNYLRDFTGPVNEANYIDKATDFLSKQEDFYDAIDAIQKVKKFIDEKLPKAKDWQTFIKAVTEELKKAAQKDEAIEENAVTFHTQFKENVVKHYQTLRGLVQQVKDSYFQLFSAAMKDCARHYKTLARQATDLIEEINGLPKGLNKNALQKANQIQQYAKQRTKENVKIDYDVKDKTSRFTYSEVLSYIDIYQGKKTDLDILQAGLVREAPKPSFTKTGEIDTAEELPPAPIKIHTYKTKLPSKKMKVTAYKNWLMQELKKLASAKDNDQIEIEE